MIITHETTIEEYESWLATNPAFTDFKVAVRSTFRSIYKAIGRIKQLFKRVNNRSCLAGKLVSRTIYPLSYDKNTGYTRAKFRLWLQDVAIELCKTREHIKRFDAFDCLEDKPWADKVYASRTQRIANIEQEIAMEQTLEKALEILKNITH